jgi:hypothetical protein
VYRGLVEDEVAVVVPTVLDGVVTAAVELLDGLMEVFLTVVWNREFDRNGSFDSIYVFTYETLFYNSYSQRCGVGWLSFVGGRIDCRIPPTAESVGFLLVSV